MSLFEIEEDKLVESMKHLRTPLASSEGDDVLPPLSSLSVASVSSNQGDDSSSVSSLSCDGDDSSWGVSSSGGRRSSVSSGEKRSIFGSYWTKKGGRPQVTGVPTSASSGGNSSCNSSESTVKSSLSDYENLLENNEAAVVATRAAATDSSFMDGSSRRRLFNHSYVARSTPSLPTIAKPSCLRKTQSARTVGTPKASCLRECRYSSGATAGPQRPRRASAPNAAAAGTAVRFSAEVQIQYIKSTTENFAERGWSKYFM